MAHACALAELMRTDNTQSPLAGFLTLATFVIVVAILRIAEDVLIPVALAIMLAFLLSPVVARLCRWGLSNTIATIVTALAAFSVIGGVGWVVVDQVGRLVQEVPKYEDNLRAKIALLTRSQASPDLTAATELVERLQQEIQPSEEEKAAERDDRGRRERAPTPVRVVPEEPSAFAVARDLVTPLLSPLGTGAIVVVFVIALLLQRIDLRDRFIKVVSVGRLNVATQAVDDAARRVSAYLGMQLVVNATYGIPIGIGLYFIGVPSALLWGLLATLLRFIPFLGPWIAASFPIMLAAAVEPGWTTVLLTIGLFVVIELISNNIIEIWLYGASTGISNFALLVAAVFWTWLWGTAGLFLSTPLTVCLLVLGKYVPGLKFLNVLLGSEPALSPPKMFYHRMLSMDFEQMLEIAVRLVRERSLGGFYNDVFIPALIMAEEDRQEGSLAEVRQRFIFQSGRELIEELERLEDEGALVESEPSNGKSEKSPSTGDEAAAKPAASDTEAVTSVPGTVPTATILGVPARDDADEVVALMLRHLLRRKGYTVDVCPVTTAVQDHLATQTDQPVDLVFVSALPPSAVVAARSACRRMRRQTPQAHLLVGLWSPEVDLAAMRKRFRDTPPDGIATSLAGAITQLEAAAGARGSHGGRGASAASGSTDHVPEDSPEVAAGLARLASVPREELVDTLRRELAQAFDVPIALVSLEETDRRFWQTHAGLALDDADEAVAHMGATILEHVLAGDDACVIEDTRKEQRLANLAVVRERGIRFFAAIMLRTRAGQRVGSLTITDAEPREVAGTQKRALEQYARAFMAAVETGEPGTTTEAADPSVRSHGATVQ